MIIFKRLFTLFRSFRYLMTPKSELILKIAALEHQLALFKEKYTRPRIAPIDRILWVWFRLLWRKWKDVLYFVKPETVKKWHKKCFRLYWRYKSKLAIGKEKGRPLINSEIITLIYRMATENITWRAPRIHGELLKLGYNISERTVSRHLRGFKSKITITSKWMTFIRNQVKGIAAMDFLIEHTIGFKFLYVFFIVSHDRRHIIHFAVTYHPTALWVSYQIREAFKSDKWLHIKYLIHDRDAIFSSMVTDTIKNLSIKPVETSIKSPWQNGIAERWVGNCRRELLDHVIIINERHLDMLLTEYVYYYNEDRTHYNLSKDPPLPRSITERQSDRDEVIAIPRLGGLHHRYIWKSAA